MTRFILLTLACICFSISIDAQDKSWRKNEKLANELFKARKYAQAAELYEAAWKGKTSNKELIHKAGECYYLVRDFKKAALAFENIKEDNNQFDLIGLKYARCLKQDGQYDAASRELVYFINSYDKSDKTVVADIVQNEIRGCELGIQEMENLANSPIAIEHLSNNINTTETEFAPIPFSDGILYFSSMMKGKAKIYRSQYQEGSWSKAKLPKGFSNMSDKHFCNGSFSPDSKRFYFTICNQDQVWGGLTSNCGIFYVERENATWSDPKQLDRMVNLSEHTSTHPLSVHEGGKEIIYFSSNRSGGQGGMDLWYIERDLTGKGTFTAPQNLGPTVNTTGDDITPFYDALTGEMFFSSNGHVSLGGYDIFKTSGSRTAWNKPTNLGMPINSPADDSYYVHIPGTQEGYVVSNRTFGMEKVATTQEDIFSFGAPTQKLMVQGNVYDNASQTMLDNVTVALYEKMDNGEQRLWSAKDFETGSYSFRLIPQKNLILEASKEGYETTQLEFNTYDESKLSYVTEIHLSKGFGGTVASSPSSTIVEPTYSTTTNNSSTINNSTSTDNTTYTNTPTSTSTYPAQESTTISPPTYSTSTTITSDSPTVITSEAPTVITSDAPTTITSNSSSSYNNTTTTYNNTSTYPESNSSYTTTTTTSPTYTQSNSSNEPILIYSSKDNPYNETITDYPDSSSKGNSTVDNSYYNSSPKKVSLTGEVYKIQLIAVETYTKSSSRYSQVLNLGRLDTEAVPEKGWTRVLLADFYTLEEARNMLETVEDRGFKRPFIVKYRDGSRVGRIK